MGAFEAPLLLPGPPACVVPKMVASLWIARLARGWDSWAMAGRTSLEPVPLAHTMLIPQEGEPPNTVRYSTD